MYCNNCGKDEQSGTVCKNCGCTLYDSNSEKHIEKIKMFSAFKNMLKNWKNFDGRTGRNEYWLSVLPYSFLRIIMYILYGLLVGFIYTKLPTKVVDAGWFPWVMIICTVVVYAAIQIPVWAIGSRRLHDTGRSGFLLWLNSIPLLGTDVLFIMFLLDSEPGDNRYGANPKGAEKIVKTEKKQPAVIAALGKFLEHFENFSGRFTRRDFWLSHMANFIIFLEFGFVALRAVAISAFAGAVVYTSMLQAKIITETLMAIKSFGSVMLAVIAVLAAGYAIVCIIPTLSSLVRRIHDTGRSAKGLWLFTLPVASKIIEFLLKLFVNLFEKLYAMIGAPANGFMAVLSAIVDKAGYGLYFAYIWVPIVLGILSVIVYVLGIPYVATLTILDGEAKRNKWDGISEEQ